MTYVNIDIFLIIGDAERELFYVEVNRVFTMATSCLWWLDLGIVRMSHFARSSVWARASTPRLLHEVDSSERSDRSLYNLPKCILSKWVTRLWKNVLPSSSG